MRTYCDRLVPGAEKFAGPKEWVMSLLTANSFSEFDIVRVVCVWGSKVWSTSLRTSLHPETQQPIIIAYSEHAWDGSSELDKPSSRRFAQRIIDEPLADRIRHLWVSAMKEIAPHDPETEVIAGLDGASFYYWSSDLPDDIGYAWSQDPPSQVHCLAEVGCYLASYARASADDREMFYKRLTRSIDKYWMFKSRLERNKQNVIMRFARLIRWPGV
jgi:hypothetical protein